MPLGRSPVRTRSQIDKKNAAATESDYPTEPEASTSQPPADSQPATHNPAQREQGPQQHEATRAASIRSTRSVEARIRQRQLEAEESLANIRRDQLELQALLIKKRLDADIATLRDETDRESIAADNIESSHRVDEWLQQTPLRGESRAPRNEERTNQVTFERAQRPRSPTPARSKDRGIDRLAEVLERMVRHRAPPRQTQDLPTFSGAAGEWLPFKAAMRDSTKLHGFSPAENLARMRTCLKGEARQAVSALLFAATDPAQIMRTLEQCYGRPEMIIDDALEEMKKVPKLSANTTAAELNSFAIKLQNVIIIIDSIDERGYLQNPMLTRVITEKLTPHLRSRWCDYVEDRGSHSEPEIITLSKFLMREAERSMRYTYTAASSSVTHGTKGGATSGKTAAHTNQQRKAQVNVYATGQSETHGKKECLACGSEHDTPKCSKLAAMTVPKRWDWAKETRICFQCLNSKHRRFKCKSKKCGVNECKMPHHALLHAARESAPERETAPEEDVITASTHLAGKSTQVLLKVCPITIKGCNGREINTYALLDEGSTITLIDEEISGLIGARGPVRPLRIHGVTSSRQQPESRVVNLKIRGRTQDSFHSIQARTVKDLALGSQSVDEALLNYTHLQELKPEHVCYALGRPRVLIGADNWHLIVSRKLLTGTKSQPAASLTELGWIVHGTTPRNIVTRLQEESVLHVRTLHERDSAPVSIRDDDLSELVKSHFDLDALGISNKHKPIEKEERAVKIFNETVTRVSGRYEAGLPWKSDDVTLPPSYDMALSRLRGIERKLDRCPQLREAYTDQIDKLVQKGYATRCKEDHSDNPRMWYLPHFAVLNPNKPGKVRIVFDAAAKVNGTSLNDVLLDGPDLLRALHGILLRFRIEPIAVVADIREMFLRVQIRKEDRVAQHFLWRGNERATPPQKYVMKSMIFGARSSPFMAHSVRDRNAADYKETHPLAYRAIVENHYMDDWVDSFETTETATRAIKEVRYVHSQAGFEMAGWMSNVPEILEGIPDEDRAVAPRELGSSAHGKTLGMIWIPESDELAFNTNMHRVPEDVKNGTRTPTKREILSAVMSIYDPEGILSPYSISAKILLQGLWKKQLGWDDELPMEKAMEFAEWMNDLSFIEKLRLPRCYEKEEIAERELHVFCDASDQAYACAVYWRFVTSDSSVKVILVAGKAKVAPLRPQSIPRMELQAALIGARLATAVVKELRVAPDTPLTFWSDSKTVIHWIRNDSVRYTPFVAHRLSEIAELTRAKQWRWVPTAHNVADDATRPGNTQLKAEDRWFVGPTFLYERREDWPQEITTPQESDEVLVHRIEEESPWITITRFSQYERLVRTVGRVLFFIEKCRRRATELTASHLKNAERLLIKQAQQESFCSDIKRLKAGKTIERGSRIRKLDPMMDKDGIIRLNGRINAAAISEARKNPPILDGSHHFAKLLIRQEHRKNNHAGREMLVNNLRQRYWVTRLRPAVRGILYECVECRTRKARPAIPVKGNLPEVRLTAYSRPFSRCGVDCFGPMTVTIGRRHEKRWGMLFTCLVTRGVHVELIASLSTDSAIMAMRRMAARRGWPDVCVSDNGTNFHGADVELGKAYKEWLPALKDYGMSKRITWVFNNPQSPQEGGVFERMIRSVKTALGSVLKEKSPKEEILQTLMAEVEYTVNSRPLTHVSVSTEDDEALTPNHFLLGSADAVPHVGECDPADRRTWRAAQALANMFWQRWLKEYLPTLAPRGEAGSARENIKIGDLVVIADGMLPRNLWPRGIVIHVHPGKDGVVRSVEVRTRGGIFRRPARRLIVLPKEERGYVNYAGGRM